MRKILTLLILTILGITLSAQESAEAVKAEMTETKIETEAPKEDFKPHGSPYAKIFTNFHSTLDGKESKFAFELGRAYFGYKFQLTEEFAGNVKIDVGNENFYLDDDGDTITKNKIFMYIKSANAQYKKGAFELNFGLIDLYQFKYSEKQWGYRYIYKTFQDKNKYGSSADLGVNVKYKFIDQLDADFTISNGEGYKSLQMDNYFKYALGLNVRPVKNLLIRLYGDFMDVGTDVQQITFSGFAGYNLKNKFRIGAEYDFQAGHKNKEDHNLNGFATYATVYIFKKLNIFGRFDFVTSNVIDADVDPNTWNLSKDGKGIIAGLEYTPIKYVCLSLNYQGYMHNDEDKDSENAIYLSTQIKF